MRLHTRSSEFDSGDVVCQVAAIFAAGVLRLYQRGQLTLGRNGLSAETALNDAIEDLEKSRVSRLSVQGLTARRHND